jgi:hypothetical protein
LPRAAAAGLAFLLVGCFSHSIAQTPSTVSPGEVRFGLGYGVLGTTQSNTAGLAQDVSLRVGVLDRVDIGVKTGLANIEAGMKAQLVRGELDLAVALSGGASYDADGVVDEGTWVAHRSGRAMVLAGQALSSRFDLVFAADGTWHEQRGQIEFTPAGGYTVGVGAGLGVLFKGSVQFMPEIVLEHFIAGDLPDVARELQRGDTLIQFTVTGLFGGADARDEGG